MNDITIQHYSDIVLHNHPNSRRFKSAKKHLEDVISGYRITFIKMRGTTVAATCNGLANAIEKKLNSALEQNKWLKTQ